MTNFLLVIIIILLLCQMFGTANVFGTIIALLVLVFVVWWFVYAVQQIWKCLK